MKPCFTDSKRCGTSRRATPSPDERGRSLSPSDAPRPVCADSKDVWDRCHARRLGARDRPARGDASRGTGNAAGTGALRSGDGGRSDGRAGTAGPRRPKGHSAAAREGASLSFLDRIRRRIQIGELALHDPQEAWPDVRGVALKISARDRRFIEELAEATVAF